MRPFLLILCLFATSSSALFLKKYRLFWDIFGRGGSRTRCQGCNCGPKIPVCTYPPGKANCHYPPKTSTCPHPPAPPAIRPPRIICRYADPGYAQYGHQYVYGTTSGGGYGHQGGQVALVGSGAHGGGQRIKYQTVGFKGSSPIKGYSSSTSRELVVGARTFQVPDQHQGLASGPTFITNGGNSFNNPPQGVTKISPSTNFGDFASGYGEADDKFKISNFRSSLKN